MILKYKIFIKPFLIIAIFGYQADIVTTDFFNAIEFKLIKNCLLYHQNKLDMKT